MIGKLRLNVFDQIITAALAVQLKSINLFGITKNNTQISDCLWGKIKYSLITNLSKHGFHQKTI